MTSLFLAALFFAGIHLLVAGTGIRRALVRSVGENAFRGVFSLLSIIGLVWLSVAYNAAPELGLWQFPDYTKAVTLVLVFMGMVLGVIGLASPSQTSVVGEALLKENIDAKGITRVTRHPFLWGVTLWAIGHLIVNGDLPSVILFGTLLFVAFFGTFSIDRKRHLALGPAWDAYAAKTSNVPFAAIVTGRNRLSLAEIGWWRLGLAAAVFVVLLIAHPVLFGVPPLWF